MAKTRRENSTRRRPPTREPASHILIACGALQTENQYFDRLRQWRRNPAVKVTVLPKGRDPAGLVAYVRKWLHQQRKEFDEVWCVFDVDEFPGVADAVRLAAREGVFVAVSNPCFELWLLLHFERCTAHVPRYKSLVSKLEKHVGNYDKTELKFMQYQDGVDDAIRRARDLDPTGEAFQRNPSTGVWRLVERIVG